MDTFKYECVRCAVQSSVTSFGYLADILVLNKKGQSVGESITIRVLNLAGKEGEKQKNKVARIEGKV